MPSSLACANTFHRTCIAGHWDWFACSSNILDSTLNQYAQFGSQDLCRHLTRPRTSMMSFSWNAIHQLSSRGVLILQHHFTNTTQARTKSYSHQELIAKQHRISPLGPASICCRASSLTGLGAKVVNAQIETLEDGTARDKFWITDRMNKKVSVWFCNQLWSVRSLCSVHASATPCRSGWPSVMWSQASRDSQWC